MVTKRHRAPEFWWFRETIGHPHIFITKDPCRGSIWWYGPFKTFTEASKEMIHYYRIQKAVIDGLIKEVKGMKKPQE